MLEGWSFNGVIDVLKPVQILKLSFMVFITFLEPLFNKVEDLVLEAILLKLE